MPTKIPENIEQIKDNNPILLIAPHGRNEDDENTAPITRLMAKKLDCYAIINEVYRRPVEKKNEGPNKKKKIINLNDLSQVNKYLKSEFLEPIVSFKDEIVRNHSKALVVLIHGIADTNAFYPNEKSPVDIIIGIGLPDRPSAQKESAEKLKELIPSTKAEVAQRDILDKYVGWSKRNLNQLFTPRNKEYNDPKVESIQLEIKYSGFRDKKNIENTAERLSMALSELAGV